MYDATDYERVSFPFLVKEIVRDWKNVHPAARPYLNAMKEISDIADNYYADFGTDVVQYFLVNANTWRGPVARLIKAELRKRVAAAYAQRKQYAQDIR